MGAIRRYGFEIESTIVKDSDWEAAILPTVEGDVYDRDDNVVLGEGQLGGRRHGVPFVILNVHDTDFEISVDPFEKRERLVPLVQEAYDIVIDLPNRYKPWGEPVEDDVGTYPFIIEPVDEGQCSVWPSMLDVSIQTTLRELGLRQKDLPTPVSNEEFTGRPPKFNGQWSLGQLPIRNQAFLGFTSQKFYRESVEVQLRKIGRSHVLEAKFYLDQPNPTKDSVVQIAQEYSLRAVAALSGE